jgi:hypothetical protein
MWISRTFSDLFCFVLIVAPPSSDPMTLQDMFAYTLALSHSSASGKSNSHLGREFFADSLSLVSLPTVERASLEVMHSLDIVNEVYVKVHWCLVDGDSPEALLCKPPSSSILTSNSTSIYTTSQT